MFEVRKCRRIICAFIYIERETKKEKREERKQKEHYTQQCTHGGPRGEEQQGPHIGDNDSSATPESEDIEQLIEAWRQKYTQMTVEVAEEEERQMQKRQRVEAETATKRQTQEPKHRKQQTTKNKKRTRAKHQNKDKNN